MGIQTGAGLGSAGIHTGFGAGLGAGAGVGDAIIIFFIILFAQELTMFNHCESPTVIPPLPLPLL